jgi:hypothetical protein
LPYYYAIFAIYSLNLWWGRLLILFSCKGKWDYCLWGKWWNQSLDSWDFWSKELKFGNSFVEAPNERFILSSYIYIYVWALKFGQNRYSRVIIFVCESEYVLGGEVTWGFIWAEAHMEILGYEALLRNFLFVASLSGSSLPSHFILAALLLSCYQLVSLLWILYLKLSRRQ